MVIDTSRFSENSNLIMACHITSVYDVNRNTTLEDDNYALVKEWAESIIKKIYKAFFFTITLVLKRVKNIPMIPLRS